MSRPEGELHKYKPPRMAGDEPPKRPATPQTLTALLAVAVALVATLLLSPSIHKLDIPIADTAVGTVASANIRADRDYDITDEEATEKVRVEAAAQVRAVYFHEMDPAEVVAGRVREAFGQVRLAIDAYRHDVQGVIDAGAVPADASGDPKGAARPKRAVKALRPKAKGAEDPALTAHLFTLKDEFIKTLQVPVEDGDYGVLARALFAKELEDGLHSLVQPVMQDMLVQSKELLAAERNLGITVQRINAREQSVITDVKSIDAIKDLGEARRIIDRKADFILAELPRDQRAVVVALARRLATPNLFFKKDLTEKKKEDVRDRVSDVKVAIKKGQMIVRDGDKFEKRHLMIFRGMRESTRDSRDILVSVGIFLFTLLIMVVPYRFARSFIRKFAPKPRDIVLMEILLVATMLIGKLFVLMGNLIAEKGLVPFRVFMFLIPLSAGTMMCRFVLNSESAVIYAMVASLFAGLLLDGNLWFAGYTLIGSIVAAHGVAQASQRTTILRAGLLAGVANAAMVVAFSAFQAETTGRDFLLGLAFALSSGLLSAMVVTAFTPAVEVMFGYITDIKLLELANLNHPLLKELIVQAPGTYHHSIVVGSLVESAAEAIHANPLLARVTAYYHDIGKIKNPLYFGENQKDGVNRHDKLKPSMSALVIKTHVKDGIEIAKSHRLGQPILDIIAQHHGTALIKYFFQKAKAQAGADEMIEEREYRYPGPKPQTREAALVMLADAVEAAAKSVPDLDQVRLRGLVQKIINNFFRDEQLSECDLTLKDLHLIAAAFIRVLEGIYHSRPEYQEPAVKVTDEKQNGTPAPHHRGAASARSHGPLLVADDGEDDDEDFKRLGL